MSPMIDASQIIFSCESISFKSAKTHTKKARKIALSGLFGV